MHRIIVQLAFDRRGNRQHGKFVVAILEDRQFRVSRKPLLDCARILIADGADTADILAMRHASATYDAMTAPIGVAAAYTVENSGFVRYDGRANAGPLAAARKRFADDQAPDTGGGAKRIHAGATP